MKNKLLVKILSVALFISFSAIMFSCGNKNMEYVSKKWKLDKMEIPGQDSMIAKMDSTQRSLYESMMKQVKEKSSFIFGKDGKYTVDMGYTKEEGTFKFSDDGKTMLTKDAKGDKEQSVNVVELTADKFVSSQKDPSGKTITMYLVPAKD
jgi:Lipocalin-like domain